MNYLLMFNVTDQDDGEIPLILNEFDPELYKSNKMYKELISELLLKAYPFGDELEPKDVSLSNYFELAKIPCDRIRVFELSE